MAVAMASLVAACRASADRLAIRHPRTQRRRQCGKIQPATRHCKVGVSQGSREECSVKPDVKAYQRRITHIVEKAATSDFGRITRRLGRRADTMDQDVASLRDRRRANRHLETVTNIDTGRQQGHCADREQSVMPGIKPGGLDINHYPARLGALPRALQRAGK
jgi:hypothetical protein